MGNWIDKGISILSPKWGAKRELARMAMASTRAIGTGGSYRNAVPNRLESGWINQVSPSLQIGNQQTPGLDAIRQRARHLERNNAIAKAMLNRAVENMVADGFSLQATTDDAEYNKKAEALFWGWADSADVAGRSFLRLCHLWLRSYLRDGDVGITLLKDGRMQSFEGDLIRTPYKSLDRYTRIIDGVEVNEFSRPVGYWIQTLDAEQRVDFARVDAADMILMHEETRLSQLRGISVFQEVFGLFDHVDDWVKASVVAAKIAACYGLVITKHDSSKVISRMATGMNGAGVDQRMQNIEPGMIGYLQPGEDIKTLNPSQPQQSFPDTIRALLRLLGVVMGMPIEIVLLDFSQTNYSSARASMLQAQRSFQTTQTLFIESVLSRIYRWRISKFVKDGELEARPDSWSHRWIAPEWPYLDVVMEHQAQMLAIDAGFDTLTGYHLKKGGSFPTWLQTRKAEVDAMRQAGVPLMRGTLSAPLSQVDTKEELQAKLDAIEQAELKDKMQRGSDESEN